MPEVGFYLAIVIISVILGVFSPRLSLLLICFCIPLSHEGIRMAIFGYQPEKLIPLPLTIISIILFITFFLFHPRILRVAIRENFYIIFSFLTFVIVATIVNFSNNQFTYSASILDNYAGPLCLFVVLSAAINYNPETIFNGFKIIIGVFLAGVFFGYFEYLTGMNPVMHEYLLTVDSAYEETIAGVRSSSLFGHFLVTASVYLFAIIVSYVANWNRWAFVLSVFFLSGIALTQSRAGLSIGIFLVVFCAVRLYISKRSHINKKRALTVIFLVAIPILLVVLFRIPGSPLYTAVADRFQTAPIYHRLQGFSSILNGSLVGGGVGKGKSVAEGLGSPTGLENPWAYQVQDFGYVAMAIYLVTIGLVLLAKRRWQLGFSTRGMYLSDFDLKLFFLLQLTMFSTFNSFGTRGNENYFVWFIAALIVSYQTLRETYLKNSVMSGGEIYAGSK